MCIGEGHAAAPGRCSVKSSVSGFCVVLLLSIGVPMFSAGTSAGGGEQEREPAQGGNAARVAKESSRRPSEAQNPQNLFRGIGILILDPRDSREVVKERIREFFSEVGDEIPGDPRRVEIRRQVDALLATGGEEIPQVSFVFRQATTADMFREFLLESDSARESEEVCGITCPLRELYNDGVHIHLTKPAGEPGDTVIALRIDQPNGAGEWTLNDRVAQALQLHRRSLRRYPELRHERKPIARVFGVQVFVGDPPAAEESLQEP